MRFGFWVNKLCCASVAGLLLTACESDNSGGAPLQPVAELPQEFVDNLGGTWLCEQSQEQGTVTGTVALDNPPLPLQNTDILHIALYEQQENQKLRSVTSYCMNNIDRLPIAFTLHYDPEQINSQANYGVSANFFTLIDGNLYEASHKRDGFSPVINNGITSQVDIVLPASN